VGTSESLALHSEPKLESIPIIAGLWDLQCGVQESDFLLRMSCDAVFHGGGVIFVCDWQS
jgi:hypothetical protein